MPNIMFVTGGSFKVPTDTEECPEAFESMGKMCRQCPLKSCYRNGWLKKEVTVDNKRISLNRMELNGQTSFSV